MLAEVGNNRNVVNVKPDNYVLYSPKFLICSLLVACYHEFYDSMNENTLSLFFDIHKARVQGPAAVMQRRRRRLTGMVAFARSHSPYYRNLYQHLPEQVENPKLLPVTGKKELMSNFNEWVTDPNVTYERVNTFIDNPDLVGELFRGKYLVGTSSGTTGHRGVFLMDGYARTVYTALAGRRASDLLKTDEIIRALCGGLRTAMLYVTGGHFVAFAGVARGLKTKPILTRTVKVFPVQTAVSELVVQLNRYRPAIVCGYASIITQLVAEQKAGRLKINPVQIHLTAEGLTGDEYDRIARVFDAHVHNWYGCAEFAELTHACEAGWLHVNSDWVVFEPVDKDYQPTPPGEPSHTVLLSNLVNRIQPILRYDLGDSILQNAEPCPCGNLFPRIRVQGRTSEMLTFPASNGEKITIGSLVFKSIGDCFSGIRLFQIVQTTPTNLRVRMLSEANANPDHMWKAVHDRIIRLLAEHKLDHVAVERAEELPQQTSGGKYRTVIPLSDWEKVR